MSEEPGRFEKGEEDAADRVASHVAASAFRVSHRRLV